MTKESHGLTGVSATPLQRKAYRAWSDIVGRCCRKSHDSYSTYGGKGITVQDSWQHSPGSFYAYVSSLPNFSLGYSIDRVDNSKGYVEGNLRWATAAEQCRNQGKSGNNTSGKNGVTWYYNSTGGTRAIAWWQEDGKSKSKSYPVKRFGLLPSFALACQYRDSKIAQLNLAGAGYSDKHGK
jgi:hypothetical protein